MLLAIHGKIACGKSTACKFLSERYSLPYFSMDNYIEKLYNTSDSVKLCFASYLGSEILYANTIDKIALRRLLYSEESSYAFSFIVSFLKIFVKKKLNKLVAEYSRGKLIIEVPLLVTYSLENFFDKSIFVHSDYSLRYSRFMKRGGDELYELWRWNSIRQNYEKPTESDIIINNNSHGLSTLSKTLQENLIL
jgi:dephospho-CoA kinase